MVKYTDIHKAIVDKLKSKFAGVEITSNDISEGFSRPSFFISFDNMKSNDFMGEALDRELTVRIYYFSKDRYKNRIELLNVQDDLNELFIKENIIPVDADTKIEIEELEFDVVDKVLHCYFDIRLSEDYNRIDDTPNMEDLDIDLGYKIILD